MRYNIYNIFLFFIVISLIFGVYGIFHPTSILAVLLIPLLRDIPKTNYKPYYLFLAFWLGYALFLILFVSSSMWKYDYYLLIIHCIVFMEILVLSKKVIHPLSSISNAWVFTFLLSSLVALWEISSGYHLASAREGQDLAINALGDTYSQRFASAGFYNPNTYCLFIVLSFPFIIYNLSIAKNIKNLIFNVIPLLFAIIILFFNGSRGALFSIAIMFGVYVFLLRKSNSHTKKYLFITIFLIFLIMVIWGRSLMEYILFRLEGKDALEDNARVMLWLWSWNSFLDSNGLGLGPGSMIDALENNRDNFIQIYRTHNALLEILLEYGVIITFFIVYYLILLFKKAIHLYDIPRKVTILGSLFAFPFYSVINSENLRPTFIWVFFASLTVFCKMDSIVDNGMKSPKGIQNEN